MELEEARQLALSPPGVVEQPHFEMASFRVSGKIFVTAPPDGQRLHVFVDEDETRATVAEDRLAYEELQVTLSASSPDHVFRLLSLDPPTNLG